MWSAFFLLVDWGPLGRGGADLARFARLTLVGKSAGHQLVSPADFPTNATKLANGIYRLIISCEILPTHSSINFQ